MRPFLWKACDRHYCKRSGPACENISEEIITSQSALVHLLSSSTCQDHQATVHTVLSQPVITATTVTTTHLNTMNTHLKANRHPISKRLQHTLTPNLIYPFILFIYLKLNKHKVQSLIFSVVFVQLFDIHISCLKTMYFRFHCLILSFMAMLSHARHICQLVVITHQSAWPLQATGKGGK